MAKTFEEADKLAENGKTNLDAMNNPYKYVANAIQQGYTGFQVGQQMGPNLPGGGFQTQSDIASFLGGAAAGAQRLEDIAPLSQISPTLAQSFPEVANMPAKQAYDFITKMSSYFSQQNKQLKPITSGTAAQLKKLRPELTEAQIQSIDEGTGSKYVLEFGKEQGRMSRTNNEYAQTRLEMQRRRGTVDSGVFSVGFVPTELNYKPFGGNPTSHPLKGNQKIDESLEKLSSIQERVNSLYGNVIRLAQEQGMPINVAISSYLKNNPEASAAMDSAGALLPMIAKGYSGEVGNLNEFEQQRAKAVLPNITPSWLRGAPDTIEALQAKQKMFNDMVGIGQKIMYSRAFNNALSTVNSGIYGSKQGYINDLLEQYSDNPDMTELINRIYNKSGVTKTDKNKPSKDKGKKLDIGTASLGDIIKAAEGE